VQIEVRTIFLDLISTTVDADRGLHSSYRQPGFWSNGAMAERLLASVFVVYCTGQAAG